MLSQRAETSASPAKASRLVRDPDMDDDFEADEAEGKEGVDVDPHALQFIRARKTVHTLHQARKTENQR